MFAVEDTSAQVVWTALPEGPVTLRAGDAQVTVDGGDWPGAVDLTGLPPDRRLRLEVEPPEGGWRTLGWFRTLPPPPGEERYRFATVNDVHLGVEGFGVLKIFRDPPGTEVPHALRCAGAALTEALDWGARRIVVKGDLTQDNLPAEWESAGRLLSALPVPVDILRGNHDAHGGRPDGARILASHGLSLTHPIGHHDLDGFRLVLVDTVVEGEQQGRLAHVHEALVDRVRGARGQAFVAMHHYPQRFRLPNTWPPGVPATQAGPLLDDLARVNRRTFLSSGHTHRHRRHHHGPLVLSEVGSTKDYPGTWAGYVVHEGGIRQVVRRVAAPAAIAWTDPTRKVLGGLWGPWAEWTRPHRCFTVAWG